MKKIIFFFAITLCLAACTQRQREGWKTRAEKIAGERKPSSEAQLLDSNSLVLTKDKTELIGIETVQVKETTVDDILDAPGELVPDPNSRVAIDAPLSGRITALNVNLGGKVTKGSVVAVIENPENLGQRLSIHSPSNGIVSQRLVNVGEWIEAGKQLMEVVDYSDLQVIIHLYTEELRRVKMGQVVELCADGIIARGSLVYIAPSVDQVTRTVEIRAGINKGYLQLKAQAYVTAKITVGTKRALVVPESAVLPEENHYVVFVKEEGRFEKQLVETGVRRGGIVEIRSGLINGQIVVSKGAYELKTATFSSRSSAERDEEK